MNNMFKSFHGKFKVLNDGIPLKAEDDKYKVNDQPECVVAADRKTEDNGPWNTTLADFESKLECICSNKIVSGDYNYALCTMAVILHKMTDKLKLGLGIPDAKNVKISAVSDVEWSAGPIKVSSQVVNNIGADLFKVVNTKQHEYRPRDYDTVKEDSHLDRAEKVDSMVKHEVSKTNGIAPADLSNKNIPWFKVDK